MMHFTNLCADFEYINSVYPSLTLRAHPVLLLFYFCHFFVEIVCFRLLNFHLWYRHARSLPLFSLESHSFVLREIVLFVCRANKSSKLNFTIIHGKMGAVQMCTHTQTSQPASQPKWIHWTNESCRRIFHQVKSLSMKMFVVSFSRSGMYFAWNWMTKWFEHWIVCNANALHSLAVSLNKQYIERLDKPTNGTEMVANVMKMDRIRLNWIWRGVSRGANLKRINITKNVRRPHQTAAHICTQTSVTLKSHLWTSSKQSDKELKFCVTCLGCALCACTT